MTVDLDWLADDEGNLRPAAARALMGQEPATVEGGPPGPAGQPPRPGGCALATLLLLGAGAALLVGALGREREAGPPVSKVPEIVQPAPARLQGRVIGANVNLRAAPGLSYPVLDRLQDGTTLEVTGHERGWCDVSLQEHRGWVFGAYVRGSGAPWRGPAVVLRTVEVGGVQGRALRPGEKVLVEAEAGEVAAVLLPSGERVEVPRDALVYLD